MAAAPHTPHHEQHTPAPRKPYVLSPALAYDPDETLDQFFARRRAALDLGERAWRERTIKAQHLKLYERLVDAVGAHQYCWVKVHTLEAEFGVDDSTIKRWLAVLEKAQLIRRQRQYGVSSRTYITAYDRQPPEQVSDAGTKDLPTEHANDAALQDEAAPGTPEGHVAPDPDASFFEREAAPSKSAFLHRHVKDLPLNPVNNSGNGGGACLGVDITDVDPQRQTIIDDEGINTGEGRRIIAALPLEELRAIQGYLDAQHNVRDRAGLLVWLARRGFGAELLAGRARVQGKRQQGCAYETSNVHAEPPQEPREAEPIPPAYAALWQTATEHLALSVHEWQTWIAPTRLLVLEEDRAIIGVPNIFVRDELTDVYHQQLEAAISTCVGRPIELEIIIAQETRTTRHDYYR